MYTHKMVNGERVNLTAQEIAEFEAQATLYVPPAPPAPTKEELLAELQALTAKINALG
jgi:dihydrodipicolinate synthase/N-acetylneuraminate lyase